MSKLIDLATFRAEARAGKTPEGGVFRITAETPEVAKDGSRKFRFCFSDGAIDRAGDTIAADGWVTAGFLKNPVALWAHNSWEPPIGRASNLAVEVDRLMGDIEFAAADVYPFADTIYRLIAAKYVNAVSVGFMPIEWSFVDDKERKFGIDFKRQELLEISVVPVPCNANALVEARAKGIDTRPLLEWAERLLDTGGSILIPRKLLEDTFRAAKTPHTIRQAYLRLRAATATPAPRRKDEPDWKVGAARDLPIDDSDSWDGAAAKASIFAHAGGDDFDPAIARKGFLAYDAAKPKEKGSYKLPFAHVVDGELKAVAGGIRAAADRLPNTDIPEATRTAARAVIDHYEERMSEDKASLTALRKLINAELKRRGIKAASGSGEGDGAGGGDAVDGDDDDDDQPQTHAECVRAAHIHVKTAGVLYGQADALHKKAKGLLQKAVDHFDNPEAEKSADGNAQDCVRAAHGHMKAASDLADLASEHHDKAADLISKAVDYIENPEAEGDGKAAAQRRAAAFAERHAAETDTETE